MSELLPFQKRKGVMVDIETFSTRPNACIISIGAVKFDFCGSTILDKFKVNVDPASCKSLGLHIDKKTVEWWMEQPKEVRQGWMTNPQPLPDALKAFEDWWGNERYMFWCNGMSFDSPIISSAYCAIGKSEGDKPWKYADEMDLRTAYSLIGFSNRNSRKNDTENIYHDALGDAIAQATQLMEFFGYDAF